MVYNPRARHSSGTPSVLLADSKCRCVQKFNRGESDGSQ